MWRYHPFFTNSDEPIIAADLTHRRHAVIETVFADLIDGPLAPMPSRRFAANSAWAICAMTIRDLLRAAGTLARPSTSPPGRHAAPPDRPRPRPDRPTAAPPVLHLPRTGPGRQMALDLDGVSGGTPRRQPA